MCLRKCNCEEFKLGINRSLFYCSKCSDDGLVKQKLIDYLSSNRIIPCFWHSDVWNIEISSTKTMIPTKLQNREKLFFWNEERKTFGIVLCSDPKQQERLFVSLGNVIQNNPGFLESLLLSTNLLQDKKFIITFDDLKLHELAITTLASFAIYM